MTVLDEKAPLSEMTMLSEMTLPGQEPSGERIPAAVPGDLAARVRALRRARREAQTRASRVRRVLLAPTAPRDAYPHAPKSHR